MRHGLGICHGLAARSGLRTVELLPDCFLVNNEQSRNLTIRVGIPDEAKVGVVIEHLASCSSSDAHYMAAAQPKGKALCETTGGCLPE
jgi:hypothetical protein